MAISLGVYPTFSDKPSSQQAPGFGFYQFFCTLLYEVYHDMCWICFQRNRSHGDARHVVAIKMVSHWGNMALLLQPWVKVSVKATLSGYCAAQYPDYGQVIFFAPLAFLPAKELQCILRWLGISCLVVDGDLVLLSMSCQL